MQAENTLCRRAGPAGPAFHLRQVEGIAWSRTLTAVGRHDQLRHCRPCARTGTSGGMATVRLPAVPAPRSPPTPLRPIGAGRPCGGVMFTTTGTCNCPLGMGIVGGRTPKAALHLAIRGSRRGAFSSEGQGGTPQDDALNSLPSVGVVGTNGRCPNATSALRCWGPAGAAGLPAPRCHSPFSLVETHFCRCLLRPPSGPAAVNSPHC
jgi:hypothetical protein